MSTDADNKYTAYFTNYGAFLASWLLYELLIEMLIKRELKLEARETSIICSAMPFGVKFNVLLALLRRDPSNSDGILLLKKAQSSAERNNIAHGFLTFVEGSPDTHLVNRDIKDGKYRVKSRVLDIRTHVEQFQLAFDEMQKWTGISERDLDDYGQLLEADAKARPSQDNNRPESPASSEHSRTRFSQIRRMSRRPIRYGSDRQKAGVGDRPRLDFEAGGNLQTRAATAVRSGLRPVDHQKVACAG